MQAKSLAARERWKKSLLLFGFYQERGKQMCLRLHKRRQVFYQRMVQQHFDTQSKERARLLRRIQPPNDAQRTRDESNGTSRRFSVLGGNNGTQFDTK